MFNFWIIALFIIVMARDALPGVNLAGGSGSLENAGLMGALTDPRGIWVWVVGGLPYLAIVIYQHLAMLALGREIDQRGSRESIFVAERTALACSTMVLLVHFGNVFFLGWLGSARQWLGDAVLLDELACVLPAIGVMVAGWYSGYGIERRVRHALMMRSLDQGEPVYAIPTRGQFVLLNLRTQLGLSLAPICMIAAWHEIVAQVLAWLRLRGEGAMEWGVADGGLGLIEMVGAWLVHPGNASAAELVLQLLGVGAVFILSPLLLSLLWDTAKIGPGELRDRLLEMCRRHGVKVRAVLVWRTYGSMSNGAVVGMIGPCRYVLLTDALLEKMSRREIEAVMAHEIGHARHAHMPWLAAVLFTTLMTTVALGQIGLWGVQQWLISRASGEAGAIADGVAAVGNRPESLLPGGFGLAAGLMQLGSELVATAGALGAAILVFGFVSRRFEWQADCFAAKALTLMPQTQTEAGSDASGSYAMDARRVPGTPAPTPVVKDAPQGVDANSLANVGVSGQYEVAQHPASSQSPAPEVQGRGSSHHSPMDDAQRIQAEAVAAMSGALRRVAMLNSIPISRRSFRHGSIAQRMERLLRLVGLPMDQTPIDRTVGRIKRIAMLILVSLVAFLIWDLTRHP